MSPSPTYLGTVTPFWVLPSPSPQLRWISGLAPPPLFSSSQSFCLYLTPRRPGPLFLSRCPPCRLPVTPPRPLPCWLPVSRQPSHRPRCPGQAGEFLLVPGKNNWGREKGPQSPRAPAPLPPAWGSLPESAGLRQEALRFLASPRRPPDLAPAPRPTAQILFRRRSRWWREEAQAERGFQGGQAWGFLSPGLGLRPPQ